MPAPDVSPFVPWSFERIVATPAAVDRVVAACADGIGIGPVRLAPDEVLVSNADARRVEVDDPYAIREVDRSFSVVVAPRRAMERWIGHLLEWHLPSDGATGQGLLCGVPVKLVTAGGSGDSSLALLCPSALVHELEERLP